MKRAETFLRTLYTILVLGLVLGGCSGSKQTGQEKSLTWPPPPDEPRIKYVKTMRGEQDYQSTLGAVTSSITGKSETKTLFRPFDVCTDGNGRVWVTDAAMGVLMFDENKRETRILGETSPVPLSSPRGIAYGKEKLFVGTADYGQVIVLGANGDYLYTIGKRGQFQNPIDVVYDSVKHQVIVVDNKLHSVIFFTETGDSLFAINNWGSLDGYLHFPQSAALDTAGNVYVVDAFNFRVQVFDSTGTFVRKFGQQGNYFGTFARPKGIALDTFGNIYVLDAVSNNFQIFSNDAQFLMYVGTFSAENDGFQNPVSIAIDRHNRIYITDQLNGRLQVFDLLKGN